MKKLLYLCFLLPVMGRTQDIAVRANELLSAYTMQHKFSGNVLIAKGDSIVFEGYYGYADSAHLRPNDRSTEFRVGSLTKMLTSTLILQLVQEGRLSLEDPLSKYVPHFSDAARIQVKHLLSHTSGIKGRSTGTQTSDLAVTVSSYAFDSLSVLPGSAFEYNNFNYILLSYIAQKIGGAPFEMLLQEKVLQPAGMQNSGLDRIHRPSKEKAFGYVTNPSTGNWQMVIDNRVELAGGAGALYSTMGDLFKWYRAILNRKLLTSASYETAFTPVKGNYGLGWIINKQNGRTSIGHSGSIEGFVANFIFYPKEEISIIFLSNYGDADGRQLSADLSAIVFNEPWQLPVQKKAVQLSTEELNRYTGEYLMNEHFSITVSVSNGKLFALAKGDAASIELIPEGNGKFFLPGPETSVEFLEENGRIQTMLVHLRGGMKLSKKSNE